MTFAPSLATDSAISAPIPLEPPVTRITLLSKDFIFYFLMLKDRATIYAQMMSVNVSTFFRCKEYSNIRHIFHCSQSVKWTAFNHRSFVFFRIIFDDPGIVYNALHNRIDRDLARSKFFCQNFHKKFGCCLTRGIYGCAKFWMYAHS